MNSISHEFAIKSSPEKLRDALASGEHIKNWWTTSASLTPEIGSIGTFEWKAHGWRIKVLLETIEGSYLVQWKCLESNMQNSNAWVGTEMKFRISFDDGYSKLNFSHDGYKETPCKQTCTEGWKHFLGTSLKNYLETGIGTPYSD